MKPGKITWYAVITEENDYPETIGGAYTLPEAYQIGRELLHQYPDAYIQGVDLERREIIGIYNDL